MAGWRKIAEEWTVAAEEYGHEGFFIIPSIHHDSSGCSNPDRPPTPHCPSQDAQGLQCINNLFILFESRARLCTNY